MEFDIINDLISDTIGKFFSNESQISIIDDFRGMYSSQLGRKSSSSVSNAPTVSSSQQNFSVQPQRNVETSPYIPSISSQSQQNINQAQPSSRSYSGASSSSTLNTSTTSSQGIYQSNSTSTQASNGIESQRFNPVAQRNNLFDQSREPLTPELWLQREGPNKLREAQSRLNLNLSRVSRSDLENMSLDQLVAEKKKVKQELKMYDASFQAHFNRFPQKEEKEPLRPLYIYYKKLKQFMSQKGQAGSDNEDDTGRNRATQPSSSQQQQQQTRQYNGSSANQGSSSQNNPQQAVILRQIEELRKIRTTLRDTLHSYQSDFFRNHNRRIRYHRDIEPVVNEYRQYKETKLELARLEALLQTL